LELFRGDDPDAKCNRCEEKAEVKCEGFANEWCTYGNFCGSCYVRYQKSCEILGKNRQHYKLDRFKLKFDHEADNPTFEIESVNGGSDDEDAAKAKQDPSTGFRVSVTVFYQETECGELKSKDFSIWQPVAVAHCQGQDQDEIIFLS
jgi:hypothetical protein